jgi:hypothetical protein
MNSQRGVTCQLTAFHVQDPPDDGVTGRHEWMAIASAQVYNASPDTGGILDAETAVLAGAVMEVVHGRATAVSQRAALIAALDSLLFALTAKGFIREQKAP